MFFPDHLEGAARLEALLSVAIRGHALIHGEVRDGECHGRRELKTSNGGLSLCSEKDLTSYFRFRSSVMQVGTKTRAKFKVFPFQGENSRSSLN
jgi:hypothetical protein